MRPQSAFSQTGALLPGLALTAAIGVLAWLLAGWHPVHDILRFSPLILAILLGVAVRNSVNLPARMDPGIRFGLKRVLRLAIILLGFRLSIGDVMAVGGQGIALIALVVSATFAFTVWLGRRAGLAENLVLLIACGQSICGASAVVAGDAVIGAEERETAYAVGLVTVLGTALMLLYPWLDSLLHLAPRVYAAWTGSSIHEVAQVVAAGFAVNNQVGAMASLYKLTRVAFIVPASIALLIMQARRSGGADTGGKLNFPWFVVGFLVSIGVHSAGIIPAPAVALIRQFDTALLVVAMAAMGLETHARAIRGLGLRPLALGLAASTFMSVLALGLASWML